MKVRQWSFFYGALLACAAFGLLASTSAGVTAAPKRCSASEIADPLPAIAFAAAGSQIADPSAIAELGSMTVLAHRVRVA